ncbi:PREDICTED: ABC transporter G family member 3-like [Dinoponera quadriceps]|uniref:Protein white n=1 Tax=Dinoponera quadriceps TaxID=609295 RepID=A0A6P3XLX1_DINQU|nr:PREDICTED: ABC transporter G family member 3-like [Dinoponera quadriceps]
MTAAEETEPLISTTPASSVNKIQRVTYHTISFEGNERNISHNGSPEASFSLKPISSVSTGVNLNSEIAHNQITYTWSDVNVYLSTKNDKIWDRMMFRPRKPVAQKHILEDVCGVAYPGELLVIMGASGAGKTTLLNTLTFRPTRGVSACGLMAANGQRVSPDVLTSLMAYVQQDDLFIGTLTVAEHLMFQAMVRMDRRIPRDQRIKRVNEVIEEQLALSKCRNTIIGVPGKVKGLSGGEMKRLSFASEVLTDPPLMFCDEPTSGLDSFMAHQVVSILKALTARGKTIIATLHQPSSELFALFDKILLMAEGRVAFMGTAAQACSFFKTLGAACPSNYNPADYFVQTLAVVPGRELVCRHAIKMTCDNFQRSEYGVKIASKAEAVHGEFEDSLRRLKQSHSSGSPYKATWCEQFRAVLWRSWLSVIKEPILIKVRLLQTVMVSLLIGVIYFGQRMDQDGVMNINGALFIFLTNMTFQNVFAVINVFCAELPIFLREHRNGMYRTDVYFICKTLAEAPVFLAVPLIFTVVVYPMVGLYPDVKHFLIAAGTVALVANVSTSFGYLISCVSNGVSMALSIGPPVIIPFMLFGGFFLNTASIPSYFVWFSYLSWFRYGNEALLINQWAEIDSIECTRNNTTCPRSGHTVLQTFNFKEEDFWTDIVCLFSLIAVFRFLAFLALLSKTRRSNRKSMQDVSSELTDKLDSHSPRITRCARNAVDVRPEAGAPRGATLSWQHLSVYAMDRNRRTISKQLINSARGVVRPGELTAILGGSGAGKSSLMTALAFRTGPGIVVHGEVHVNGASIVSSYMRCHSGFMHQEDMFIETMTVLEHIWFMARMKLDGRIHTPDVRRRIDHLLRDVGLIERRDVRIGAGDDCKVLSGGEKKKLAFATELLTDPEILFLDEPTTGQDAHSASVLVSHMTTFALRGRTILCTIHQPSSAIFNSFHRIILLAGGRVAFAGTGAQAIQFFSSQGYTCPRNYNPADFLVATLAIAPGDADGSGRAGQRICDAFLTSEACNEIDVTLQREVDFARSQPATKETVRKSHLFEEPCCWLRLYWLIHRGFLQVLRDPSVQLIRILQKVSLAMLAGLCFVGAVNLDQLGIQAIEGVIYILVCENTFFPMYATLALIPQELPLLLREYRAGMYPIHLYYVARMISLIPGLLVEPTLFTVIIYWLTGLRPATDALGLTLLVVVFTINVSTACGCFFSAVYESVPLAMAYLVPFDYILMITMGPFVKLSSLPIYVRWLRYFSWLLHSTEALTIIQWRGVHNISCEINEPELPCLTEGSQVLDHYDFDEGSFWTDIVLMAGIYTVFHLLAYVFLWKRCRSK